MRIEAAFANRILAEKAVEEELVTRFLRLFHAFCIKIADLKTLGASRFPRYHSRPRLPEGADSGTKRLQRGNPPGHFGRKSR
jgi:hypothetical protein